MPDPAKHAALEAIGFRLASTCATCVHWAHREGAWGTCGLAPYRHAKHTALKVAGTPMAGACDLHTSNLAAVNALAGEDYAVRYWEDV